MMTTVEIAVLLFALQQITVTRFTNTGELVAWMGAMQAHDYRMSKWAIGVRVPGMTNEVVEQAIDKGEIVRTHVLRPAWHLVAAKDIRWMLSLTKDWPKKITCRSKPVTLTPEWFWMMPQSTVFYKG